MNAASWMDVGQLDELARLDTPAHRLDARAKAVTTMLFIVAVMSFPRYELSSLMPFFLFPVVLITSGRIPGRYILKKVLVALPFAFMVGIWNPILDTNPQMVIGPWFVSGGWISFASILVRFSLTVSAALALVACTGMHRLCHGLERLGMPRVFAVQLLFLHRYLFVVADECGRMLRSIQIRSTGNQKLYFRTYISLVGHLLLRAMDRADRVYRSMVARGFDGEIHLLSRSSFGWQDFCFVSGWAVLFLLARCWNLSALVGRIFVL